MGTTDTPLFTIMHAVIAAAALGILYVAATGVVTGSQEASMNKKMNQLTTKINGSCEGAQTSIDLDLGDQVVKLTDKEVKWRKRDEDTFSGTKDVRCEFDGGEKTINSNEMLGGRLTLRFKEASDGGYQMAGIG